MPNIKSEVREKPEEKKRVHLDNTWTKINSSTTLILKSACNIQKWDIDMKFKTNTDFVFSFNS